MTAEIIPFVEPPPIQLVCSFCKKTLAKDARALVSSDKATAICMPCIKVAGDRIRKSHVPQ